MRFSAAETFNSRLQLIADNGITRSEITKYAPLFPDKAIRTLVESEIIYIFR